MSRLTFLLLLPLLFLLPSCSSLKKDTMNDICNVKYNPELISGQYYYYKEIDGYGDPHALTSHHIIYIDKKNDEFVEVCKSVYLDSYPETAFKWQVYSNNIVYVWNSHKEPYPLSLVLYSPKTGYHTLIPDYLAVAELKYDKTGIKFYYYDKTGNKPDYSKPYIFTAKRLGDM